LAKNNTGYQNLVKLTSLGYIEGMYSKYPRIDKKLIEQYKEGLIATTCCIGAYVPQTILKSAKKRQPKQNSNGGSICLVKIISLKYSGTK
jgi:DNA polymerase III subunit alpha